MPKPSTLEPQFGPAEEAQFNEVGARERETLPEPPLELIEANIKKAVRERDWETALLLLREAQKIAKTLEG